MAAGNFLSDKREAERERYQSKVRLGQIWIK